MSLSEADPKFLAIKDKLGDMAVSKLIEWGRAVTKAEAGGHDHEMRVLQARKLGSEVQSLAVVLADKFG